MSLKVCPVARYLQMNNAVSYLNRSWILKSFTSLTITVSPRIPENALVTRTDANVRPSGLLEGPLDTVVRPKQLMCDSVGCSNCICGGTKRNIINILGLHFRIVWYIKPFTLLATTVSPRMPENTLITRTVRLALGLNFIYSGAVLWSAHSLERHRWPLGAVVRPKATQESR